ncbi:MAG: hypothetical protein LBI03_10490 [Clostridiales bacterium]|nr:hypothetical protein [Clostridiales bacterium]
MEGNRVYITSKEIFIGKKTNSIQKEFKIEDAEYEPMLEYLPTRNVDRISKISLVAATNTLMKRSVIGPNFNIEKGENNDYGVVLGTQFSALESIHQYDMEALNKGALAVNPGLFPNTVLNSPACQVSIQCSFAGPVYTVCNGLTSSLDAIGMGYNFVRSGLSTMVLAGGIDEITELQAMMKNSDKDLGEAGGFLLLESGKTIAADKRLAEIIGYKSKTLSKNQRGSFAEAISCLIFEVTNSGNNNDVDASNISVGSAFSFHESETVLSNICKKKDFTGAKEYVETDWMGACGIAQANRALEDIDKRYGENVIWMLINIDKEKVSALALKSV